MARIDHRDQGDTWVPQASFTVLGVGTDPTTVTVRIKKPDGTVTVLGPVSGATGGGGIIHGSAGVYTTIISLDDAGYWFVRFEGSGVATAAEDHEIIVDPSEFYETAQLGTRALVGLAETKDWLQHQNVETEDDLELARVINDISDRFHQEAEREFKPNGTNPADRLFDITQTAQVRPWMVDGQWMGDLNTAGRTVPVGDLASFTQVQIIDTDWTTILETVPLGSIKALPLVRQPWEPIRAVEFNMSVTRLAEGMQVKVSGTWGFPSVPGNVRQAVMDAVASVMDRDVEHYRQDLGMSTAGGEATTILIGGGSQRLISLPPGAQAVAWWYRQTWIA